MERAGPTFIKLGQWAASRADLFPASLCEQMGKLHSNGDPHSIQHTRKVIEKVFGQKFEDIFETFEEKPIGCGAIAQVYRAKLKPEMLPASLADNTTEDGDPTTNAATNTEVAIKVLHPRAHKTIRRDIAIMSIFANIVNLFPGMEWISLPEEVAVFGEMMESQLDLRVEANNLDRFLANFGKRGPGIAFPQPFRLGNKENAAASEEDQAQVLIEEYEDALPLKYFLRNGGGEYDDRLAKMGLDAFLVSSELLAGENMLLIDNWTHGDLHPGNIMVRFHKPSTQDFMQHLAARIFNSKEGKATPVTAAQNEIVYRLRAVAHDSEAWIAELDYLAGQGYEPELIFIDAGLVTTLNTENRRNFLDLFQAVAEFDGYRAGHLMVERCRSPELAIDPETFALKMQHVVLSVKSKTFSLAAIKISDVLTEVLTSVRQHHVKMEGDFVNTVISILLLEGIGRQLDPNLDLFKSALPILRQLGRQMRNTDVISQVPKGDLWAMAKVCRRSDWYSRL
ncbi:hypothetical protein QFC22_000927 [Naganishia vaughanmartiniae]|uniref:Uncharacterized protein n=1 Tax=Naganishia vaughanmartiniae TaxID=1424756 RepID=A0ACC2XKG3_9TREE|nr:hypothetical protein QFC22_000927 [Naganishia vaughanmartiniae]